MQDAEHSRGDLIGTPASNMMRRGFDDHYPSGLPALAEPHARCSAGFLVMGLSGKIVQTTTATLRN